MQHAMDGAETLTAFSGPVEAKESDIDFLQIALDCAPGMPLVLDVGCGSDCQCARWLQQKRTLFLCCLDMSTESLKKASTRMGSKTDFVRADFRQLGAIFRPRIFDMVSCFYSMQHAAAPLAVAKEMVTITAPSCPVAVAALADAVPDPDPSRLPLHPLPSPLRHCYKSFLPIGVLSESFQTWDCQLERSWVRTHVYQEANEFPCSREYTVVRKSNRKRRFCRVSKDS